MMNENPKTIGEAIGKILYFMYLVDQKLENIERKIDDLQNTVNDLEG